MPHLGKKSTRFQQVGAASQRLGLSVKQTLPIVMNTCSRFYNVDCVKTELRTPQIYFIILDFKQFVNGMKRKKIWDKIWKEALKFLLFFVKIITIERKYIGVLEIRLKIIII